jgi:transcription elongation factor Elf1
MSRDQDVVNGFRKLAVIQVTLKFECLLCKRNVTVASNKGKLWVETQDSGNRIVVECPTCQTEHEVWL